MIGFLWAFAVVAEVGVFGSFNKVFGRFSATTLLLIAGSASVVRWIAYPLVWPAGLGVPGLFAVQGLHCLSTGLLLIAVQKEIAETVAEEQTGAAQGAAYLRQRHVDGHRDAAQRAALRALRRLGLLRHDRGRRARHRPGLCSRRAQPQSAGCGGDTNDPS